MALPHEKNSLTYADYLKLEHHVKYEVIDNIIYNMTPSPTPRHQDVVTQLSAEFTIFLRGKTCRIFVSPIDVCLSEEKDDLNKVKEWVSPDLVIVCDKNKIGEKRIIGSPDLVVEVLSPSTAKQDRLIKFNRYERAGIKEYWIIDPIHQTVEVYVLSNDSRYVHEGTYFNEDIIRVSIFDDFHINLNNIFRKEL